MVRFKNRYIVVEIIIQTKTNTKPETFTSNSLYDCINKNVQKHYGDFGVAAISSGIKVKYCNDKTKIVIFRIRHGPHRFVTSILPLITVAGGHTVKFRTIYIGATLMQSNKFLLKHQQQFIDRTIGKVKNDRQKEELIHAVMNFSAD